MRLFHSSEDLFLEPPIRVSLKADEIRYDLRPVFDPHLRRNHVCARLRAFEAANAYRVDPEVEQFLERLQRAA